MTLQEALNGLRKLNTTLPQSKLYTLAPFNKAYETVTESFQKILFQNLFLDASKMEQLDGIFARFYFRAVESEILPIEWQSVLSKTNSRRTNLFLLLLGANVHINHDLPLALEEFGNNDKNFKKDFFAADAVFPEAVKKILQVFDVHHKENSLPRWLIKKVTLFLVIHWRHRAWQNFLAIQNGKITKEHLVKLTQKIASRLG